MYDVIVVGQGPAGSTASYHLAQKGLKVLGLDKATFPRCKPCGGCISKKAERILDFDIKEVLEDTVYGATLTYRYERALEYTFDRPIAANTRRVRFDHLLVERAKAAGAEVLEGRQVEKVDGLNGKAKDPVTVLCKTGEVLEGKLVVLADGAAGKLTRGHFHTNNTDRLLSITAEVPYEGSDELSGKIYIDFGCVPHGYAWIFPKKGLISIGVAGDTRNTGGSMREIFNTFVKKHPMLKNVEVERPDAWTLPTFYTGEPVMVNGRALLVGDAGGLVDRFLGEGIYTAVKSAQIAASVIYDGIVSGELDLAPYKRLLKEEFYNELAASAALSSKIHSNPRLWYRIVEKDPDIMQRYFDVIRGDDNYVNLYGLISKKIRSKPFKFLERWIESRFLPA
jgi:geranylgeranyl reductase family protein